MVCGCKNYWVLQKELGNSQYDRSCDVELSQKKLRRELALFFLKYNSLTKKLGRSFCEQAINPNECHRVT